MNLRRVGHVIYLWITVTVGKKSLVCSLKYMFASFIHYDVMINDVYPLSS